MKARIQDIFAVLSRSFGRESVILFLRIWLGVMMVYHGSDKLFRSFEPFTAHIHTFGVPLSKFVGGFVIFSQFVGGAMIFFGFLTRPALICILLTVFSAVLEALFFLTYDPFSRKAELALLYSVLTFALFITGPGLYSVDSFLSRERSPGHEDVNHDEWRKS